MFQPKEKFSKALTDFYALLSRDEYLSPTSLLSPEERQKQDLTLHEFQNACTGFTNAVSKAAHEIETRQLKAGASVEIVAASRDAFLKSAGETKIIPVAENGDPLARSARSIIAHVADFAAGGVLPDPSTRIRKQFDDEHARLMSDYESVAQGFDHAMETYQKALRKKIDRNSVDGGINPD